MGIASMVIGILSLIIGFIPFCGSIALLPAAVGLVLGIVDVAKKSKANLPKGSGVAGIATCGVAIAIICMYLFVYGAAAAAAAARVK